MLFLILNLLQQQTRLSKVVIVGAVLLFIAGVSLLVYFYRRYQRIEKEPEEDWDLSRRSLFANVTPPAQHAEEHAAAEHSVAIPQPSVEPIAPVAEGTRQFASKQQSEPAVVTPPEREVRAPQEPPVEVKREPAATQILASSSPVESTTQKATGSETTAGEDEVWDDLDLQEQHDAELVSKPEALPPAAEPPRSARVEQRSHREPFESPRIERITHREPYEPPRIAPVTPREHAEVTRELQKPPASARAEATMVGTPERETRELAAVPFSASPEKVTQPAVASSRAYRAPAGSVLGLPAEASDRPLILGDPVRPANEAGIGALTNYGKDLSPKAGRGGTIALLVVLALLGGALLVYLFVPPVHSRVNAYVAHVRGIDTQGLTKDKAQIFPPHVLKVDKNMVTAGAPVDNISDEPLENLEVEISQQRSGDAPPDIRRIPVTPGTLAPSQRGTFEFEYDGKRDTGYATVKITRLLSNGSEIKFRTPNQK
jgi:hypothetical protein